MVWGYKKSSSYWDTSIFVHLQMSWLGHSERLEQQGPRSSPWLRRAAALEERPSCKAGPEW